MSQPLVKLSSVDIRAALETDLDALLVLEQASFETDRLSRRSFKHWLKSKRCVFLIAQDQSGLLGYGLVLMRKGTRLGRLYSIAVAQQSKGLGVGRKLLQALEEQTVEQGKLFMRLEVACNNEAAIKLYESVGYRSFGVYKNYYHNSIDALRMQKPIHQRLTQRKWPEYPWYQQTTEFTCGPSSLMMAMAELKPELDMSQALELDIWRQATTIFMTSGHGGCHPIGLGLAAHDLGFTAKVYVNTDKALFIDGVRSEHKKTIMRAVDERFKQLAEQRGLVIDYSEPSLDQIQQALESGSSVICLISTYQLDGKKIPHWVAVTHIDDDCLYFHDPDPDEASVELDNQQVTDCQHVPLAREDFHNMSAFGKNKLRTAVIISKR
ncbi:peptidase C39 family protein [Aliiglaciecola sp. LCG003]|uniref:peptidase C39 family protein n=1 Tax=Aliiglaciecola sp. LCG003 TaxID=3053655 RepID=UPI0025722AAA|nr:peptidase C39 family protein [Aliiglaciecola sp. LCG003]WJG07754.1 peptidase C39 family protein [Aliiglaciecola sp. LCG003]